LIYDFIVVGGGVAGASISYWLKKSGRGVLLLEKDSLGSGGSGAAGAFLNPKVGKKGDLNDLVNSAMEFSIDLYRESFSDYFHPSTLYHHNDNGSITAVKNAGVADPIQIINRFTEDIDVKHYQVEKASFKSGVWSVGEFKSKNIVLSTGGFPTPLISEPNLSIRPVWGQRIDVELKQKLENIQHREVSVSHTINGRVRIGATHYREVLHREISHSDSRQLLQKASFIDEVSGAEVVQMYGGVRSASRDYFPIIGGVIDSRKTLQTFDLNRLKGGRISPEDFIYHPNLYLFSGLGGYGFSLAPYLSKKFVERLDSGKLGEKMIEPYRFFDRWVRRLKAIKRLD
jgi:tRNA 5-methylaminomethyl-2-thiouridine biosynthesis bifunctional protein